MNIYLIGYRCCGKTSVGNYVSEQLGLTFIDADQELESDYETTIPEMVAERGWDYFRTCEKQILKRLCGLDDHVISTGGGAVIDPENRTLLKSRGTVFWLTAAPETIRNRMQTDENTGVRRPALTGRGLFEEISSALESRRAYYEEASDFKIKTDDLEVEKIGRLIMESVKIMNI